MHAAAISSGSKWSASGNIQESSATWLAWIISLIKMSFLMAYFS
jgi:hypothetical protein